MKKRTRMMIKRKMRKMRKMRRRRKKAAPRLLRNLNRRKPNPWQNPPVSLMMIPSPRRRQRDQIRRDFSPPQLLPKTRMNDF